MSATDVSSASSSSAPSSLSSSSSSFSSSSADVIDVSKPFDVEEQCYYTDPTATDPTLRICKECKNTAYPASTGSTNLIYHMWAAHSRLARRLGVPPHKRFLRSYPSASSPVAQYLSNGCDDDLFPPSSSSSSASSVSSCSSSFSSPTVVIRQLSQGSKRIQMAPPSASDHVSKRAKQQSIAKYGVVKVVNDVETQAAVAAQIDFWLYEGLSNLLADSAKLRNWLELFRQGSGMVASRKQIAARQHERAAAVKERVVARLKRSKGITVGLDGWTNVGRYKVINIVPISCGVAYYWKSITLKSFSAAVDQAGPVTTALREVMDRGIRVSSLVTDNEEVNKALYKRLFITFPFLIHIPCAAHTIQLCVRKAMELQAVCTTVDALEALLWTFKVDKRLRVDVKEQQALLRRGEVALQIIRANDTRWNSLLIAAERALRLESCIAPFTADIRKRLVEVVKKRKKKAHWVNHTFTTDTFWLPLQQLVTFLKPYKHATDVAQSDTSTLADVHLQFVQLINKADDLLPPHALAPLRSDLLNTIKNEWNTHVNKNAVIICTHLAFDPAYSSFPDDERAAAQTWFFKWGKEYIKWYGLSTVDEDNAISAIIMMQYGQFTQRTGAFATIDELHEVLRSDHNAKEAKKEVKQRRRYDARHTWNLASTAELTQLAITLLSITASEAAVERTFSRQGLVHSKLRNRLSDRSVQSQMFFSFNTRALEHPDRDMSASWEELPDEEVKRGTTLLSQEEADQEESEVESDEDEEEEEGLEEEEGGYDEEKRIRNEEKSEIGGEEVEIKSGKEGREEREEKKEELSMEQQLAAFVKLWRDKHHITDGYRWTEHRVMALQSAIIAAGIKDMVSEVQKRIKRYVASADDAADVMK
jgi:hypothetical protein